MVHFRSHKTDPHWSFTLNASGKPVGSRSGEIAEWNKFHTFIETVFAINPPIIALRSPSTLSHLDISHTHLHLCKLFHSYDWVHSKHVCLFCSGDHLCLKHKETSDGKFHWPIGQGPRKPLPHPSKGRLPLRTDQPMFNCLSHRSLLHFSFFLICTSYYHQDLHLWRLLLLVTAGYGPDATTPSIFRTIQFGSWVATDSLADSDFHGHCPAVYIN